MNMVQKVARVLDPEIWDSEGDYRLERQRIQSRRDKAMQLARETISAMLEPTDAMVAAFDKDVDDWFSEKIADPMHLYKVMIDAALKEGTR